MAMYLLPESPRANRLLRMSVALFICVACASAGLPFLLISGNAVAALGLVPDASIRAIAGALMPGVLGSFLLSVACAFLLFTLTKVDIRNKEAHLARLVFLQKLGRAFLWLTAPIAVVWLVVGLVAQG